MITDILYPTTTAATSVTTATAPLDLGDEKFYSLQAVFTGVDVAGTFKLQRSDNGLDFEDIPGATKSVTSSATALLDPTSQTGAPSAANYRFVRFQWTYTSGTGNLTVISVIKQMQTYN